MLWHHTKPQHLFTAKSACKQCRNLPSAGVTLRRAYKDLLVKNTLLGHFRLPLDMILKDGESMDKIRGHTRERNQKGNRQAPFAFPEPQHLSSPSSYSCAI